MSLQKYTDSELQGLLDEFNVACRDYRLAPLTLGYINDTFLVKEDGKPLYILQRINHKVFPNVSGLMGNIEMAFRHLEGATYTPIELVETRSGSRFLTHDTGYWRLMTYIDQSTAHNTTRNPKIAQEAGRIIGAFHLLLEEADSSRFVDTIPRFHDLDLRRHQFLEALEHAGADRLAEAGHAMEFAHGMLEELHQMIPSDLPIRVCHNDTKLNNILFSKESHKALCLIDLDTLMRGYFYYDFGDAVRTIANTAPEDEQDHSKIVFERELFDAFVHGLAANGPFLTNDELATLPMGAVFMPFIHGLRALTDYLLGDVYYKVAYGNQNLDRCLSLFDFTKKAFAQMAYMKSVVGQVMTPRTDNRWRN